MPVAELARELEARGYWSLYIPEHTHIPISRRTPPPTGDPELPEEYRRTLDPFVALASAASVTSRLRLGTGVCLVAQHDPIVLAKTTATLDLVSGGRFVFGIGFGWNEEEAADHGVPFRRRRAVAREKVLAIQRLWEDEVASFAGEHVRFEPSWSWPKPVQRPRPPVMIGGTGGPALFAHIAEYADGWMPIGGGGVRAALPALHRAAEAVGRDPSTLEVVPFGVVPEEGKLEHYASLGIREVAIRVPSAGRD
ncbi:MAG: LLM class F420-dependent oxidoreductase, partial [Acidimicrobiia bacterium]